MQYFRGNENFFILIQFLWKPYGNLIDLYRRKVIFQKRKRYEIINQKAKKAIIFL